MLLSQSSDSIAPDQDRGVAAREGKRTITVLGSVRSWGSTKTRRHEGGWDEMRWHRS